MPECEICREEVPENEMVSVSSARIAKLTRDDFVPERLPKSGGLEFAEEVWARMVKEKKGPAWKLCRKCEREAEAFSPTQQQRKRAQKTTGVVTPRKKSKWDLWLSVFFILVTIGFIAWCYWVMFMKH